MREGSEGVHEKRSLEDTKEIKGLLTSPFWCYEQGCPT